MQTTIQITITPQQLKEMLEQTVENVLARYGMDKAVTDADLEESVGAKEAERIMGVSKKTLYREIKAGNLEWSKPKGTYRFKKRALYKWLGDKRAMSAEEIADAAKHFIPPHRQRKSA